MNITVPAKYIAALRLFAADKDVRFYMNGINLEIGATESILVATDGVVLGCFRVACGVQGLESPLTDIIIPNELLNGVKLVGDVELSIGKPEVKPKGNGGEYVSNSRPVTLTCGNTSVSGKTIDGSFPTWRAFVPRKVSGEPAQFDVRRIAKLAKAASILHGAKAPFVTIGYNGEGAALIDLGDDFSGAIMPLRSSSVTAPCEPPAWVFADMRMGDQQ